ncbi:Microtubule-associated protein mu-2 [Frankliniella fusca]|uniref:Microtubule-associated protein mu-2 n=1 Tax=Frankliniella fusca TaxID=407009 RepID=A0AAE1LTD7_9NEOP|nr:Microtubule-associated protein mu-2 [Frankliniella fusca]
MTFVVSCVLWTEVCHHRCDTQLQKAFCIRKEKNRYMVWFLDISLILCVRSDKTTAMPSTRNPSELSQDKPCRTEYC